MKPRALLPNTQPPNEIARASIAAFPTHLAMPQKVATSTEHDTISPSLFRPPHLFDAPLARPIDAMCAIPPRPNMASRELGEEQLHERSQQRPPSPWCMVIEFTEAEIEGQTLLRYASMRSEHCVQQRPPPSDRMSLHIRKGVIIVISLVLTAAMYNRLLRVAS